LNPSGNRLFQPLKILLLLVFSFAFEKKKIVVGVVVAKCGIVVKIAEGKSVGCGVFFKNGTKESILHNLKL